MPRKWLIVRKIKQPALCTSWVWQKVNFLVEFNMLVFRVFFLLDQLIYQGWRAQSVLLFTHSWRENSLIRTLLKGISTIWTAPSGIWTNVTVSVFYDDNHYSKSAAYSIVYKVMFKCIQFQLTVRRYGVKAFVNDEYYVRVRYKVVIRDFFFFARRLYAHRNSYRIF